MTEIYYLTVLEIRSLNQGVGHEALTPKPLMEDGSLLLPNISGYPQTFLGL